MRRFFSMLVLAAVAAACGNVQPKDIVLTFDVADMTADEIVLVYHNEIRSLTLDGQGHGELVLDDMDAVYARLFYAADLRSFKQIYLEAGDRVNISFNGKDYSGTFAFDGEKAAAVKYLNDIELTALPDEDYALPFDEYMKKLGAKEADAVKLMRANKPGAGNFEEMEEGRIRYSYGNQVLMYPLGHRFMAQDMSYEPDQSYYDAVDAYLVENDSWADLDQYRDFIVEASHILDQENRNVTAAYPKAVAQMKFIADRFSSDKVRNTLLHYLAYAYVDNFGVGGIQDMENVYRTYVKDTALVARFDKVCEKWNLASVGKPSPDFKATDVNGKEYTLADFRGKYVYIDIWATWCGPCRQEIPHLKALEENYRDAQITFLSLSVDNDKAKWEKMVKEEQLSGVQLYLGTGSDFQSAYQIDGIPRFILLDKEGKIIDKDMQRPSNEYTRSIIDALEGIR